MDMEQEVEQPLKKPLAKYLVENKDLIGVVSSILVGVASVLIGLASLVFMSAQSNLQEEQLNASKRQNAPNIFLQKTPLYDEQLEKYFEEILEIRNSGGDVLSYSASVKSFVEVNRYLSSSDGMKVTPIFGHFFASVYSGFPNGVLSKHSGHRNLEAFGKIHDQIRSDEFRSKHGFIEFTLLHVVQVKYLTKHEEQKVIYFIDQGLAHLDQDKQLAKKLFDLHKQAGINSLDVDQTNADEIMDKIVLLE